jgi:prevent-host-death family protein
MANQQPPTQTLSIAEVTSDFSGFVDAVACQKTRVVIAKNGSPVVAIVSAEDWERLSRFEREREERFAVFDRMREAFADVSPEELEREAELSVAAARERIRRRNAELAARSA